MMHGVVPFSPDLLVTPTNNSRVVVNHWWVIDAQGNALMHRQFGTPQCNSQKEILERFYPGYEHRFIAVAYFDEDKAKIRAG